MNDCVITNEWLDVASYRVPIGRDVLVRSAHGLLYVARWNGYYWVDSNTNSRLVMKHVVPTHFYIYDRFCLDL